jgi:hypothetical protein
VVTGARLRWRYAAFGLSVCPRWKPPAHAGFLGGGTRKKQAVPSAFHGGNMHACTWTCSQTSW